MPQGKVFYSFAELAEVTRFEASKAAGRKKPNKLPPLPKPPVPASHEKPKVKGRVNARQR